MNQENNFSNSQKTKKNNIGIIIIGIAGIVLILIALVLSLLTNNSSDQPIIGDKNITITGSKEWYSLCKVFNLMLGF